LDLLESSVFARHHVERIIVDSATLFASRVPDKLHHDYASSLDIQYAGRNKYVDGGVEMDRTTTERRGYRWEEGISEWVVATPAANLTKHRPVHKISEREQRDFDPMPDITLDFDRETSALDELLLQAGPCRKNISTTRELMDICAAETKEDSDDQDDNMSDSATYSDATSDSTGITALESDNSSSGTRRISHTAKGSPKGRGVSYARRSVIPSVDTSGKGSGHSRAIQKSIAPVTVKTRQEWGVFDDSDDELSFVSVSSKQETVMRDITNKRSMRPIGRATGEGKLLKRPRRGLVDLLSDSEDELCFL
jgi:hypothetical protein